MPSYGAIVYLFKIIDMKSSKGAYICEFLCFFFISEQHYFVHKMKNKNIEK